MCILTATTFIFYLQWIYIPFSNYVSLCVCLSQKIAVKYTEVGDCNKHNFWSTIWVCLSNPKVLFPVNMTAAGTHCWSVKNKPSHHSVSPQCEALHHSTSHSKMKLGDTQGRTFSRFFNIPFIYCPISVE